MVSRSSDTRSGKYRYAVASETRARFATSGSAPSPPDRASSRQASTMARRVRVFWFARPPASDTPPVTGPDPWLITGAIACSFMLVNSTHENLLAQYHVSELLS